MATAAPSTSKFVPGYRPEEIALMYAEGKPMPANRYNGEQVMFTLTDNRKWFTEPYVAQIIAQARIQQGEVFTVAKVPNRRGSKVIDEIKIALVIADETKAAELKTAASNEGDSTGRTNSNTPNSSTPARESSTPAAVTPTPPPVAAPRPSLVRSPAAPPVNGNGETSKQHLMRCYRDAIDVASYAMKYASERQLLMTPTFEDIRALAATICIQENGGGRR